MDIEKVLEEMQQFLPAQPAVRFKVKPGQPGLFDCKVGGTPYFPKNMEYPRGKNHEFADQPLFLLAQLNFEKLPSIPDFPKKGILQFFIAGDDMYGMADCCYGEKLAVQENFRVIYHENILTDESMLLSADEIPQYTGDGIRLPFSGTYFLVPQEPEMMPPKAQDYRFGEAFLKVYNKYADEPCEDFFNLDEEIAEPLFDSDDDNPEALIGGYPVFAQSDPREDEALADCDVLLFELDSYHDDDVKICWGDVGTGSFFIPRENLKALDFSRVLYNYDCG